MLVEWKLLAIGGSFSGFLLAEDSYTVQPRLSSNSWAGGGGLAPCPAGRWTGLW